MSGTLRGINLTFPVLLAERPEPGVFVTSGQVLGTCFSLGGDLFMTAGHVVRGIRESGKLGVVAVAAPHAGDPRTLVVAASEELPCDLGILRTPAAERLPSDWVYPLRWRRAPAVQLDPVWTLGFPYGTHEVRGRLNLLQRAFRGHVVSDPPEFEIPQLGPWRFGAYELSFPAPRGLSGSPLLRGGENPTSGQNRLGEITMVGIVIGNSASQMLVFSNKEVESGPENTTTVERYESLSLGIAVQQTAALGLPSELLSSTVGEHLTRRNLLAAT